jgi:Fe-S cluster assembly scaffold protein SufB
MKLRKLLEGCTAPSRDENQLHAAVVELVAWTMLKSNIRPYKTGIQETKKVKVAFSIL